MRNKWIILSFILALLWNTSVYAAKNIYMGDSRTVLMYRATHDDKLKDNINLLDDNDEYWSCKNGAGYVYMNKTSVPNALDNIKPESRVFVLYGVNDAMNDRYFEETVELLNELGEKCEKVGAHVFYVTLFPVYHPKYESMVCDWNVQMRLLMDQNDTVSIINIYDDFDGTWSYLDDVHQDFDCSREIYQCLKRESSRILLQKCGDHIADGLKQLQQKHAK